MAVAVLRQPGHSNAGHNTAHRGSSRRTSLYGVGGIRAAPALTTLASANAGAQPPSRPRSACRMRPTGVGVERRPGSPALHSRVGVTGPPVPPRAARMDSLLRQARGTAATSRADTPVGHNVPGASVRQDSSVGGWRRGADHTRSTHGGAALCAVPGATAATGSVDSRARARRSNASIRAGVMLASTPPTSGNGTPGTSTPPNCRQEAAGSDVAEQLPELVAFPGNVPEYMSKNVTTEYDAQRSSPKAKRRAPACVVDDFEACNWLSDASISFASTSLASSGSHCLGGQPRSLPKSIEFMDPAMAFWLTMQDNPRDLEEARASMKLGEIEVLLCPINDSRDAGSADTGLHWTLLVCWGSNQPNASSQRPLAEGCPPKGASQRSSTSAAGVTCAGGEQPGPFRHFRYYDSLSLGMPRTRSALNTEFCSFGSSDPGLRQAEELAQRLAGRPVKVEIGSCARQTNFFDCGVYVLLFSEIVAVTFLDEHTVPDALPPWEERLRAVTPKEVDSCRAHYHSLAIHGK